MPGRFGESCGKDQRKANAGGCEGVKGPEDTELPARSQISYNADAGAGDFIERGIRAQIEAGSELW